MLKQILSYIKAWISGEEAELNIDKTWSLAWWEVGAILIIICLIIWRFI